MLHTNPPNADAYRPVPGPPDLVLTGAVVQYRDRHEMAPGRHNASDIGVALITEGRIPSACVAVDLGSTAVKELDLSSNPLGDAGILALTAIPMYPRVVNLGRTEIGDVGIKALLYAQMMRLVESLDLRSNAWTHEGAAVLGSGVPIERLSALNLKHNKLGSPQNLIEMVWSPMSLHLHRPKLSFDEIDLEETTTIWVHPDIGMLKAKQTETVKICARAVGVGCERAREPDPLLHTAGQFVCVFVAPALEFDERQNPGRNLHALVLADRPDFERHGDVVQH